MFELFAEKTIAAAHFLRNYGGPCERLHGHNYRVMVFVRGDTLDEAGLLVDFGVIKTHMNEILGRLDHQNLNDLPEFTTLNPSTENIAKVIGDYLWQFSYGNGVVDRVQVWETPTQGVTYYCRRAA